MFIFTFIPAIYSHAPGERLKDTENTEKKFDLVPTRMVEKFGLFTAYIGTVLKNT